MLPVTGFAGYRQVQPHRRADEFLNGEFIGVGSVHVTSEHVRVQRERAKQVRGQKIGDGGGLCRALGGIVGVLCGGGGGLEVGGEDVERLRESGHDDLRFKQVAREVVERVVRIAVTEAAEINSIQPFVRAGDRVAAGDGAHNRAVSAGAERQIIAGQKEADEVRHLVAQVEWDFVERDDIGLKGPATAVRWPAVAVSSCSSRLPRCL